MTNHYHPDLVTRDGVRDLEVLDANGHWYEARWLCQRCLDAGRVEWADQRYSFGVYAGKYCDEHWRTSGYRDATDSSAEFSEEDAGERMDADY